jgi:hypothetical protein
MSQKDEIDISLLPILDTLFKERSVTKAGIKLNQSQPVLVQIGEANRLEYSD